MKFIDFADRYIINVGISPFKFIWMTNFIFSSIKVVVIYDCLANCQTLTWFVRWQIDGNKDKSKSNHIFSRAVSWGRTKRTDHNQQPLNCSFFFASDSPSVFLSIYLKSLLLLLIGWFSSSSIYVSWKLRQNGWVATRIGGSRASNKYPSNEFRRWHLWKIGYIELFHG